MDSIIPHMRKYDKDGNEEQADRPGRRTVLWSHNESIYYAHDRRKLRWVHESKTAVPMQKGDGVLLMVADWVSADYGPLRSREGSVEACIYFKAGKARDGYMDNDRFLESVRTACEIIKANYPDEDHALAFDNASIHLKRPADGLSQHPRCRKACLNFFTISWLRRRCVGLTVNQRVRWRRSRSRCVREIFKTEVPNHSIRQTPTHSCGRDAFFPRNNRNKKRLSCQTTGR